jgi:hypothetical protein
MKNRRRNLMEVVNHSPVLLLYIVRLGLCAPGSHVFSLSIINYPYFTLLEWKCRLR